MPDLRLVQRKKATRRLIRSGLDQALRMLFEGTQSIMRGEVPGQRHGAGCNCSEARKEKGNHILVPNESDDSRLDLKDKCCCSMPLTVLRHFPQVPEGSDAVFNVPMSFRTGP